MDSTPDFTPISQSQGQKEATANRLLAAALNMYAVEKYSALNMYYIGGRFGGTHIAAGSIAMTASNTNYVVAHRTTLAVSVSTGTTNWNDATTYGRLWKVVAGASTITSWEDHRFGGAEAFFSHVTAAAFTGGTLTTALNYAPAVTVASASTTNIGAAASNIINISGTTTITAFDTIADGAERWCIFAGVLTLTHNGTSLILPTAANIVTAAGDVAVFVSKGSGNWKCTHYLRASGVALAAGGSTTQVVFNDGGAPAGDASLTWNKTDNILTAQQFAVDSSNVNAQTGTSYTLQSTDNGKIITLSNASAITLTVPASLGAGFSCMLMQIGAGQVTITPSSTTVNSASGLKISAQHGAASLFAYAANTFNASGALTT